MFFKLSGVAWVIGARGWLQFCTAPKKSWDTWCPFVTPIFAAISPILVCPSLQPRAMRYATVITALQTRRLFSMRLYLTMRRTIELKAMPDKTVSVNGFC